MAYLVLVRHGQTEWNALGLFSGQTDVPLNDKGRAQARHAATLLRDIEFQKAYTSDLSRAKETLRHILDELQANAVEVVESKVLTERNYGVFEGKSKQEAVEIHGKEEVRKLRRAWNHPVPQGETLKEVHDRLVPFYAAHILEDLKAHKNVIVASHNNAIRALITYIEQLSEEEVETLELGNGEVVVYQIDDGKVGEKVIRV